MADGHSSTGGEAGLGGSAGQRGRQTGGLVLSGTAGKASEHGSLSSSHGSQCRHGRRHRQAHRR
eukprot:760667-Hanusia_phi.AAC.1